MRALVCVPMEVADPVGTAETLAFCVSHSRNHYSLRARVVPISNFMMMGNIKDD